MIQVAWILWDYSHPATILTFAFLVVFGIVDVIQTRHQARVENWAKYLAFNFFGLSGILASMPAIKLVADTKQMGKLDVLIDNS